MLFYMLSSQKCIFSHYEGFHNIRTLRSCFYGQRKMAKVLPLDLPARQLGVGSGVLKEPESFYYWQLWH